MIQFPQADKRTRETMSLGRFVVWKLYRHCLGEPSSGHLFLTQAKIEPEVKLGKAQASSDAFCCTSTARILSPLDHHGGCAAF